MNPPDSTVLGRAVLFDGECGLCSAFVRFVLANSTDEALVFISLQSARGSELLAHFGLDPEVTDSIVFIDGGRALTYSSAVLEVARSFRYPWRALRALVFVPKGLRDIGYRLVARYRRRLFPPPTSCEIPSPEHRSRIFID